MSYHSFFLTEHDGRQEFYAEYHLNGVGEKLHAQLTRINSTVTITNFGYLSFPWLSWEKIVTISIFAL